jgi:hypothetical protein
MEASGSRSVIRPRWTPVDVPLKHLWTGAGLLLLFPYTDWLTDYFTDVWHWPAVPAYGVWILVDCVIIATLFLGTNMRRVAVCFVAVTLLLDLAVAITYYHYYTAADMDRGLYTWLGSVFSVAYVALIAAALWWRLGKNIELFRYVLPVIFALGVSFAASAIAAEIACMDYHGPAPCAGVDEAAQVGNTYFQLASEVIPSLLVALAIEARIYSAEGASDAERAIRAAMFRITVVAFAIGSAAALTVLATGDEQLPLMFELSVQALALGFASIFILLPIEHRSSA